MSDDLEKYQGLNLPQLLDLMHPPVMGDPVSLIPETRGWIIVIAWVVIVAAILSLAAVARWKRNRYRREALSELARLESDPDSGAGALASLIRRTALAVWERETVASLTGGQWAAFLAGSCKGGEGFKEELQKLSAAVYRGGAVDPGMYAAARFWISRHHA